MIAPLLPQPGPPPLDPAAARPDPRGEGDAFAEILAAAAVAVPAPGPTGLRPVLEHGPAVMTIADLVAEPAQAGLTDPAIQPAAAASADQPQPAARIFNQDGFFGASIDAPGTAETRAARPQPEIPLAAAPLQAGQPIASAPASLQSVATGEIVQAPAAPAAPAVPAPALPRAAGQPGLLAPAVRTPILDADTEAEPLQPLARRLVTREPAARAAVQVAMRELEQGIHVAARAEGLDAAERVRLHDEIAALLARHGLSARSIRISAPARGSSQERLK